MGLSEVEKSVVKATYDDELAPKEKHCVCQCTRRCRHTHVGGETESAHAERSKRKRTHISGVSLTFASLACLVSVSSSRVVLTEVSIDYELVSLFDRRLAMPRWNVVFKALIVLHRLSIEGSERYMKVR